MKVPIRRRFFGFSIVLGFGICLGLHWEEKIPPYVGPYKVHFKGILYRKINESSGLVYNRNLNGWWTHNDGNYPELFLINQKGKKIESYPLQVELRDFEEIAGDGEGNIYIGDIGNNPNEKRNFYIYRWNLASKSIDKSITYSYADQMESGYFQKEARFDAEAMVFYHDSLFIISKNRKNKTPARLYAMPAQSGTYALEPLQQFVFSSPVTASDISSDGKLWAILTYDFLYIFDIQKNKLGFDCLLGKYNLGKPKQVEAICFGEGNDLWLSNEQGNFYWLGYQSENTENFNNKRCK